MARTADDFIFFWKPEQLHGWASQWYKSPFTARITLPDGKEHDVTFPTAEHWMMGQKALLFGDQKIFERIVGHHFSEKAPTTAADPPDVHSHAHASTDGGPVRTARPRCRCRKKTKSTVTAPRVPGPKEVKALGRKVGNFEEETWARERARIVREGLLHKFRQNPELRALLLATGEREIVEASHMDRVWGVGYGAKRAGEMCVSEEGRALWGANLLGRALEEVRRILRGEEEGREEKREDEEDAVRS